MSAVDLVTAADIPWASPAPLPRLEEWPIETLLDLEPLDLLMHAQDLREDLKAIRELLQASLAFIREQQVRLTRSTRTIESQQQTIARLRETVTTT